MGIAALYATLTQFGGITRLNDYEYTDYRGQTTEECALSPSIPVAVDISEPSVVAGMNSQTSFEERVEIFKQVLEKQPISVVMKSSCKVRLY